MIFLLPKQNSNGMMNLVQFDLFSGPLDSFFFIDNVNDFKSIAVYICIAKEMQFDTRQRRQSNIGLHTKRRTTRSWRDSSIPLQRQECRIPLTCISCWSSFENIVSLPFRKCIVYHPYDTVFVPDPRGTAAVPETDKYCVMLPFACKAGFLPKWHEWRSEQKRIMFTTMADGCLPLPSNTRAYNKIKLIDDAVYMAFRSQCVLFAWKMISREFC